MTDQAPRARRKAWAVLGALVVWMAALAAWGWDAPIGSRRDRLLVQAAFASGMVVSSGVLRAWTVARPVDGLPRRVARVVVCTTASTLLVAPHVRRLTVGADNHLASTGQRIWFVAFVAGSYLALALVDLWILRRRSATPLS